LRQSAAQEVDGGCGQLRARQIIPIKLEQALN
jgi:adenine C2-methylase RlmN of 23S rRNA A2503 and tRNA A37